MLRRTLTVLVLAGGLNLPAAAQQPSEAFPVSAYPGTRPAVASGAESQFVVVWTTPDGDGGVAGQRFDRFGIPRGGEFVVSASGSFPKVAVAPDGGFMVVWSHAGILARRYDATGTPLDASGFRITGPTSNRVYADDVAADSAGNFVVVGKDMDKVDVFAWRFDAAGRPLGSEFRVSSYTTASQNDSALASTPDGGFVVVWSDT